MVTDHHHTLPNTVHELDRGDDTVARGPWVSACQHTYDRDVMILYTMF